jgi:hypothetical protein
VLPTDQALPSPAQSQLIPLPHRPVPSRIIYATAPAAAPTSLNDPEPFNLSTVLIDVHDVHKDCYKSISQAQQGGRHRRKTTHLTWLGARIRSTIERIIRVRSRHPHPRCSIPRSFCSMAKMENDDSPDDIPIEDNSGLPASSSRLLKKRSPSTGERDSLAPTRFGDIACAGGDNRTGKLFS